MGAMRKLWSDPTFLAAIQKMHAKEAVPVASVAQPQTPVLQTITISPANPTIPSGGQQQFTATGKYSDGSSQDLTHVVDWSPSFPETLSIDKNGLGVAGCVSEGTSLTATDL